MKINSLEQIKDQNPSIDENREIIGSSPSILTKSGSGIILFLIFGILLMTYLIKYPETIDTRINVTSTQQPIEIVSKSSGQINLYNIENKHVEKGEVLGYIENEIDKELVDRIKVLISEDALYHLTHSHSDIIDERFGILKSECLEYHHSIMRMESYLNNNLEKARIQNLRSSIPFKENLLASHVDLIQSEIKNLEIAEKIFKRDSLLFIEKVISESNYQNSQQIYLSKISNMKNLYKEKTNIESSLDLIFGELAELQKSSNLKYFELSLTVEEKRKIIEERISQWEYTQEIRSPIEGKVFVHRIWENNQYVNLGETLFYVVPEESENFAYTYVNQTGFGKVQVGQKVLIKLADYPYEEFGIVEGRVRSISSIYTKDGYLVKIDLPNGLSSSFGQELKFSYEMPGICEIITEDTRLIERLLYQIRKFFIK